ncbi:RAP protein, putative [Plasmodium ovale]|uniref:RAP protein, putative n=1 Tax=Plasmodium ovale TaxID=36330 RepID=A0A1C3KTD8_PLAOA|nr:RAP protein, putative [Plasmodium ovale]
MLISCIITFRWKPLQRYLQRMTLFIFKRQISWTNTKLIRREEKKIEKTILYIEECIEKEREKNVNLLSLKTYTGEGDKLYNVHLNLVKMSYLLRNMRINENKWVSIYHQISVLHPLDEKMFKMSKMSCNYGQKYAYKDIKVESEQNCMTNTEISLPYSEIQTRVCKEYDLLNLQLCYSFVLKICIDKLLNYLPMYTICSYLSILRGCQRFLKFFFQLHNRRYIKKLNFIYLYSLSHNFRENVKMLKNVDGILKWEKKTNWCYHYEEIYNLKYHQTFVRKVDLMVRVLGSIKYDAFYGENALSRDANFDQLVTFFCAKTKMGIIDEQSIFHFLNFCEYRIGKGETTSNNYIYISIISIMYYSKIVHNELVSHFVKAFRRMQDCVQLSKKDIFLSGLKLLTLVRRNSDSVHIYNYCKWYILKSSLMESRENMVYVLKFFFVSCIIGIFDIYMGRLYINFLKKNQRANWKSSFVYKTYYTLLGWDIIINTFIKDLNDERRNTLQMVFLNFYDKTVHSIHAHDMYSEASTILHGNNYPNWYAEINALMMFYREKIREWKKNNIDENNYYNQRTIFHILKKFYSKHHIMYEYVTKEQITLDILIQFCKKNFYKNVAIEFNGRTHYNLLILKESSFEHVHYYRMVETYNTKYKKWLLSNLPLSLIYIPYYHWNTLNYSQQVNYIIDSIENAQ